MYKFKLVGINPVQITGGKMAAAGGEPSPLAKASNPNLHKARGLTPKVAGQQPPPSQVEINFSKSSAQKQLAIPQGPIKPNTNIMVAPK